MRRVSFASRNAPQVSIFVFGDLPSDERPNEAVMKNTRVALGRPVLWLRLAIPNTILELCPMKRTPNPIKLYRLAETELMPVGGGVALHGEKPANRPLQARWVTTAAGRLICQWTSE